MEWLRQRCRAIRNIAHIARHNPIWAITALTLSPIALVRHLFKVAVLLLIVGLVLAGTMQFVLASLLGLARDSNLYQLGMMLTFLVIILVTLRALFQPLILRYGGPAGDDTHGSARFATRSEEHTSELQSLMRISYAVFCLKKKNHNILTIITANTYNT